MNHAGLACAALVLPASAVLALPSVAAEPPVVPPSAEIRLPTAAAKPPASFAPARYPLDRAELIENGRFEAGSRGWPTQWTTNEPVPSEFRKGGNALHFRGNTRRLLPESVLKPGRSYVLAFVAKALDTPEGSITLRFREPKGTAFRSFSAKVKGSVFHTGSIEFTAPVFAKHAELAITRGLVVDLLSLSMRPALPRTEVVKAWSDSFVPAGYELVFNDEFSDSELDRSRWFTRYIHESGTGDRLNDEQQVYTDAGTHVVKNGVLQLVAKRLAQPVRRGIDYESGMIRSDFTLRYGFLEARVKMPAARGVAAAFWLNSDVAASGRLNWPPEIDIFEFVNNGKDDLANKLHLAASVFPERSPVVYGYTLPGFDKKRGDYHAPFLFSAGFHTIGLEWTAERLTTYVDGLKIATREFQWRYRDGELAGPAHILFNLAIGGGWAGRYGIDDAAFPQAFEIDWVRVYQKSGALR
jgi:beta-glucanase (GH16 family)